MSRLQLSKVVILALICSSLSTYRIMARPSQSLSEELLISQTAGTEKTETIKGEITEIENDIVKVQTSEGRIKEIKISETEQQQLGLKPGNLVSVTIKTTTEGVEIPEKVMLEEESDLTVETTDTNETNGIGTTDPQQTTEVQTEPVPALW